MCFLSRHLWLTVMLSIKPSMQKSPLPFFSLVLLGGQYSIFQNQDLERHKVWGHISCGFVPLDPSIRIMLVGGLGTWLYKPKFYVGLCGCRVIHRRFMNNDNIQVSRRGKLFSSGDGQESIPLQLFCNLYIQLNHIINLIYWKLRI